MVPFASVFNTAFEKVVLLVTYVVFPIASWRELHGKKTGKKVPTLKLNEMYRRSQSNGALNYETWWLKLSDKKSTF